MDLSRVAVAVGAIAECLGRTRTIEDAPAEDLPLAVRDDLLANGHELYTEAGDLGPLLDASVERTLASAALSPGEVDRIMLVSEGFAVAKSEGSPEEDRAALHARFHGMGMGRASVTAMVYPGCHGGVEALHLARRLVEAGDARNVLVVATHAVLPEEQRVLPPAVAVLGDGVATALVSAAGRPSDVALLGDYWPAGYLEAATFRGEGGDFSATLITLGRALVSLRAKLPPIGDGDVLVCNNYGLSTLTMFAKVTGFSPEATFVDTVSQHGHMGSVDILCNVARAAVSGVGTLYALGTSYTALGMLAMTPVTADTA
jgi:hypothetical protein